MSTLVNNTQKCKDHQGRERNFFCREHKIWLCDFCLVAHKHCKTLHYSEILGELKEGGRLKQVHTDLKDISNMLTDKLSTTKNEFINLIDEYQANLSKSLNLNIDYNNPNNLELAMLSYRHKQSNEEEEYNNFNKHLVTVIVKELEESKEYFLNYKIIREQEGFINQNNIGLLRKWTGQKNLQVELIFKASRDGFKAMDFHSKCEGLTPTIVIAQTQHGKLFGGFTEVPWKVASKDYVEMSDPKETTFIFSLDLKEKYLPKDSKYSVSNSTHSGPIFGCKFTKEFGPLLISSYSPDFEIVNDCNENRCKYFDVGKCYNYQGTKEEFFGGEGAFTINDYELYKALI